MIDENQGSGYYGHKEDSKPAAKPVRGASARMTAEQRSERAKAAVNARWHTSASKVVAGSVDTPLVLGDTSIECYVLEGGVRVITQGSMLKSLGRADRAKNSEDYGSNLPPFLAAQSLVPYLTPEILAESDPITFSLPQGGRAKGYKAILLPEVCEVYLKARDAGALAPSQERIAQRAEILMRGLARVGIVALVDEATGYEKTKARDNLARILEEFVAKELQPWNKTFPDDFYKELCRLKGVAFRENLQLPRYFGKVTNEIIYRRLAPGVLDELKRQKAETAKDSKLHQHLTKNRGYPKLAGHLTLTVGMMKISSDWDEFICHMDHVAPKVVELSEVEAQ